MSQTVEQAQVVAQAALKSGQGVTQIALFNADGTPYVGGVDTTDWNTIPNKPAVIAAGVDAASARTAIGAGVPTVKTLITALTVVSVASPAVAAGATPTKAEFDACVALEIANKTAINLIIAAIKAL